MKTAKKLKRKEDREGRKGRRDRPSSSFSTSSHHNKHRDGRPPHHQPHRQQAVCKRTDLSSSSSSSSSSSLPSKKKKKGGGSGAGSSFRVLGLSSYTSHAAVKKLGYTQPTPIQRRSIPILLKGRDCIIKSRTGSGKTCAYLLPLVDLLQSHSSIVGVRGLIIVPTRELVYQISSLVSRLFRDTSLRYASLIGGLNLEKQFQALSNNPDVIIATVGRITQLVQEKVLSLKAVQYLVLDEADRMFELGWGTDELRVIWNNISSSSSFSSRAVSSSSSVNERSQKDLTGGRDRGGGGEEDFFVLRGRCQAIIVSATLPSRLAEFSRLGLNNPELVQLDKELTLSQHLELRFLFVRTSQKIPCLLFLLSQHANKELPIYLCS
ncbi:dead deah box helicase domain-containing protein [Cystoisospora suis]|uniref:Dead deah box helicase domain-containing protein n=1 Tax=Cystoisospora suis TaxID=483139 RepID=A0A2C6KI46_9APIC|nr:dead deah box helicase domain-containing protein [Cystoisospora suis]